MLFSKWLSLLPLHLHLFSSPYVLHRNFLREGLWVVGIQDGTARWAWLWFCSFYQGTGQPRGSCLGPRLIPGPISCGWCSTVTRWKTSSGIRSIREEPLAGQYSKSSQKALCRLFVFRNNIRKQVSVIWAKYAVNVLDQARSCWDHSGLGWALFLITTLRINFSGWHKDFVASSALLPLWHHFQPTGTVSHPLGLLAAPGWLWQIYSDATRKNFYTF